MKLLETSVDALEFGMFIAKLDRPWTETPFMFQGFVLSSDKQVEALKKFCKVVFIDPEKEDRPDVRKVTAEDIAKIRGTTVHKVVASVEVELPKAQIAFTGTKVVVKELARAVEIGNTIDSSRSQEAAALLDVRMGDRVAGAWALAGDLTDSGHVSGSSGAAY